MPTEHALFSSNVARLFADAWRSWHDRRARLFELDHLDSAEIHAIARDLSASVSDLRVLAGHDAHAADLLDRRLDTLGLNAAKIEPAVMRDMQRCCSQCRDKTLCAYELEDRPKGASWPEYCPNRCTLDALITEKPNRK